MLQIMATLLGGQATPILDRQIEDFIRRVDDDLNDVIWHASTCGLDGADLLSTAADTLTPEARIRLALSPTFFAALRDARGEMTSDTFATLATVMSAPRDEVGEESDAAAAASYVVGDTIRVELRTEHARRLDLTSPVFCSAFEDPDRDETTAIVGKIERALDEIDLVVPTFGRLIRNYTRVIYVRKIAGRSPASEQVDTELGSIRLRNVHDDAYDHLQLMDDLIHESVHNFLGSFEYLRFPFLVAGGRNDRMSARPVSAWSFRPIQMLPFLHAAFVYFAIWNYAKQRYAILDADSQDGRAALRRYNRYASGFLMNGRLSQYAMGQADIDPRVLAALDWMQEYVRRDAGIGGFVGADPYLSTETGETIDDHELSEAA